MHKTSGLIIVFAVMVTFLFILNHSVLLKDLHWQALQSKRQLRKAKPEVASALTKESQQNKVTLQEIIQPKEKSVVEEAEHVHKQPKRVKKTMISSGNKKEVAEANKGKEKRLVFALVSVKKCGSGFMKHMVRLHPAIHLIQQQAPQGCMDIPTLRKAVKKAKEKYPKKAIAISHHSCTTAPESFRKMGNEKPEKLVFLLCDPVRRAFSDYHNFIFQRWFKSLKDRSFLQIVDHSITQLNAAAEKSTYQHDEQKFGNYLDTLRFDSDKFDQTIVSRGVYVYDLAQFLSSYSRKDILLVTGKELINKPADVMLHIQQFVNVPSSVGRLSFVVNKHTGFYCPKVNGRSYCMGAQKSRTTGEGKPTPEPESVEKLEAFYKPYNDKLTKLLGYKIQW